MGAEPARGLNSRKRRAAIREPRTKAMISGRMYWTVATRWRPRAPAMSRSKQATQIPMLVGLPARWRSGARRPMTAPARRMPQREAKKRVIRSDMVRTSLKWNLHATGQWPGHGVGNRKPPSAHAGGGSGGTRP